jgi:hypothetical protein
MNKAQSNIDVKNILEFIQNNIANVKVETFGLGIPDKSVWLDIRNGQKYMEIQFTPEGEIYASQARPGIEHLPFDGHDMQIEPKEDIVLKEIINYFQKDPPTRAEFPA